MFNKITYAIAFSAFISTAFAGGALVTSAEVSDQVIPDGSNYQFLVFGTEVRDTGGFWTRAKPTRLTVPGGVRKVRVGGQMIFAANSTGLRQCVIKKNYPTNGGWYPGVAATNIVAAGGTTSDLSCWTPVIDVVKGDYFEIEAFQNSGGDLSVLSSVGTWFSIEVIE